MLGQVSKCMSKIWNVLIVLPVKLAADKILDDFRRVCNLTVTQR